MSQSVSSGAKWRDPASPSQAGVRALKEGWHFPNWLERGKVPGQVLTWLLRGLARCFSLGSREEEVDLLSGAKRTQWA